MSYRKINVDGVTYEYVIGKKFVKVKGFGLFDTSMIGNQISGTKTYVVTPATVARAIRGDLTPNVFVCIEHGVETTELTYSPFDQEIYCKFRHMINCDKCVEQDAMNI